MSISWPINFVSYATSGQCFWYPETTSVPSSQWESTKVTKPTQELWNKNPKVCIIQSAQPSMLNEELYSSHRCPNLLMLLLLLDQSSPLRNDPAALWNRYKKRGIFVLTENDKKDDSFSLMCLSAKLPEHAPWGFHTTNYIRPWLKSSSSS